jgi:hypothetical protein
VPIPQAARMMWPGPAFFLGLFFSQPLAISFLFSVQPRRSRLSGIHDISESLTPSAVLADAENKFVSDIMAGADEAF